MRQDEPTGKGIRARAAVPAPVEGKTEASPSIGLALGGGGARGLAHILMLEAFDELGIKPKIIAGTSIGAIFGAAYAAGMPAREIRAHAEVVLRQRFSLLRELFTARAAPFAKLFGFIGQRSAILDPEAVLDIILPSRLPRDFADLAIPMIIVATDFYEQRAVTFTDGPLRKAVAASMALPVIFHPVIHEGRALIDGGLCNPLPFDLLTGRVDIVVAIDVSGATPPVEGRDYPTATEALFGSAFIFEKTITRMKLEIHRPDIFVQAGTTGFQVLDFLKLNEILAAAQPAKERLKVQLDRVFSTPTLATLEASDAAPARKQRRRLLPKPPRLRRRRSADDT